jgi:fumarate reductase flavoprotein subunit
LKALVEVEGQEEAMERAFDVVVVGGGLAGHVTAMSAAEAGAEVLVLEKASVPGGNAVYSGGSFAFAGTDMQRQQGIADSPEELRADMLDVGGHQNDPALVEVYIREQLPAYEWLRDVGVVFDRLTLSSSQSRPRSHGVDAPRMFEAIRAAAQKIPRIAYEGDVRARQLLRRDGRVTGVLVERAEGQQQIQARCGVVLATGGFSRSRSMLQTFAPALVNAAPLGGDGATGDGHVMGRALGADLADMGFVKGTFGTSAGPPFSPEPRILLIPLFKGALIVNSRGERFADESLSYKILGDLCLGQPDALGFQIFDADIMAQSRPTYPVNDFKGALARGYLRMANTLEELASAVGIDPAATAASVHRYNADVRRDGRDGVFGRASLGHGSGTLVEIASPPFYIYPCTTGLPSTYGGLRVDPAMRVIDVFDAPVPGLFAAGEVVGGFHGAGYISGSSLAKTVICARVAGRMVTAG